MPNQQALSSDLPGARTVPVPCTVTPALLKQHSITPDEYARIQQALGRVPSLTELGIFSVMWSEHCSYKSSRVHLKRLPTRGPRTSGPGSVVQGPGENAGIIDVGDGWACAFKIESHNHPSYIEPYQGAATGVGGILRDIFTMGARPLAIMDSLRFGPLAPPATTPGAPSSPAASLPERVGSAQPQTPDPTDYAKNHQIANGVVHGVAGYGNCFGVPNLGGETRFEPCYSGNPLLNAFALGLVRTDEIFYAKATGVGNPVFYVGAKTGRDGIHGATMASEEFTDGSEQKRPNVQMGDPFLEKLLLEACLEAMKTGAVLGIQDMGAAGLTCSTCEMGARGELGVSIELDLVPQRETGMTSYEIMLSESQERMLLIAQKGREHEVLDVFRKWGLDCAEVGIVTPGDIMRVTHGGQLVAEIPNKALTDDAPVYNRPVGTWQAPVPKDPPAWVLEELKKPCDYTADLLKLLASPNICDKRYIYEQFDSMVQTNTVQGPGSEAGVIRIKGTGQQQGTPNPTEQQSSVHLRGFANPLGIHSPVHLSGFASPTQQQTSVKGTASAVPQAHPEKRALAPEFTGAQAPALVLPSATSPEASSHTPQHPPDFINAAAMAATASSLDPAAVDHSILGKLTSLIAGSTPEGEATLLTGNEDAANPVVAPDLSTHLSSTPTSPPAPPPLPAAAPAPPSPPPRRPAAPPPAPDPPPPPGTEDAATPAAAPALSPHLPSTPGPAAAPPILPEAGPAPTPTAASSEPRTLSPAPHIPAPAPGTHLDPIAASHSITGKLASLIAASTPQGEATLQTGNEDAANPVVLPDATHHSGSTVTTPPLSHPSGAEGSGSLSATQPGAPSSPTASLSERVGYRAEARPLSPASPKKPDRGIAMALAGNGRWCYLDPKLGAMHAVAEAARKVACTGATPVAATNCLNFGNPEKPEIMAQLSAAIDGIAEACTALGTPITGGNVSLYNETRGEAIYPTPVIGVVGLLDDVTKAVPNSFQHVSDVLLLLDYGSAAESSALIEFGSSEYARVILGALWGKPPMSHSGFLEAEAEMHSRLVQAAKANLLHAARDVTDSLAVELVEGCFHNNVGVDVELIGYPTNAVQHCLFGENAVRVILACAPENVESVQALFPGGPAYPRAKHGIPAAFPIGVVTNGSIRIAAPLYARGKQMESGLHLNRTGESATIAAHVSEFKAAWSNTLESQLAAEVVTA